MNDFIRLLPETIANQIAAGEVAPEPSYVVKELLENSVDAGATEISLDIYDGGKESITIIDNGKGMSPQDARMAFERHATSKLKAVEDLNNIRTFGFRGEALAAISAVSQIEMRTKPKDDELGTEIHISGGVLDSASVCACPNGTSIKVKNMFYNTPARRNFLKDASKEEKKIIREFDRVAFVNEKINFQLYSSSKLIRDYRAGSLLNRIESITGNSKLHRELVPIKFEGSGADFSFHGYIGLPAFAKNKRYSYQYLFANGRYIEHKYFSDQIKVAYQGLIEPDKFPHFVIFFDIASERLDVNIHPTKIQVRFADEEMIAQYLRRLVRETLSANAATPMIDFNNSVDIDIPAYNPNSKKEFFSNSKGFSSNNSTSFSSSSFSSNNLSNNSDFSWDSLAASFANEKNTHSFSSQKDSEANTINIDFEKGNDNVENKFSFNSGLEIHQNLTEKDNFSFVYQDKYIITRLSRGITIIDIDRALERIIYDEIFDNINKYIEGKTSQYNINPVKFDFDYAQMDTAQTVMSHLEKFGFEFSHLGANTFVLSASPTFIETDIAESLVFDIIDKSYHINDIGEIALDYIARFMSQDMISKEKRPSNKDDIDDFISKLFTSKDANLSPQNKKIMIILGENEISKLFN